MSVKMTLKQLRALGLHKKYNDYAKPAKASRPKDDRQGRDKLFDALCESHGLPLPVQEYAFAESIGRKWRFDFLFEGWLAVEKVGGVWQGGHHSHGKDQIDDMEKRNHAALMGYVVLEFTPEQFQSGEVCAFIKRVLEEVG